MINKRYRLVVFDWEGTLSDSMGQALKAIALEAKRLNFGELNEDIARQLLEFGLVHTVKKTFPHLSLWQHNQLLQAVQQELMTHHAQACLIPGAYEIAARLNNAGLHLAIASNKGQQSLQRSLQLTGMNEFFKTTRSAGQTAPKPCPDMLKEILQIFDVSIEEALMVGDSVTDIEMATSIQMDSVGVNFYHHPVHLLLDAGALDVFTDYKLLTEFILKRTERI